jgi:hypothetical protein
LVNLKPIMGNKIFYLAALGWGTAVLVHGLALADVDVASFAPYIWLLHVGIFVVWIPAVFKMRQLKEWQKERAEAGEYTSSFEVFKHAPRWLTVVAFAGMAYTFLNFLAFSTSAKSTGEENGHYYTHTRGKDHRPISAQEYHHWRANDLRAFSGHWIAFYGMALAILYPFKKPEEQEEGAVDQHTRMHS